MRITIDEARQYFAHPSQRNNADPETLPVWAVYHALGGVCLLAHPMPLDGLWMVHLGVLPSAWGRVTEPARELLKEISAENRVERMLAWVPEDNRHVAALCRRVGFELDGRLPLARPLLMYGWRS